MFIIFIQRIFDEIDIERRICVACIVNDFHTFD